MYLRNCKFRQKSVEDAISSSNHRIVCILMKACGNSEKNKKTNEKSGSKTKFKKTLQDNDTRLPNHKLMCNL